MSFFNIIKEVLLKPKEFFKRIKKEEGIKNTFLYFLVFTVITSLLTALYFSRIIPRIDLPQIELTSGLLLWILVALYILILLFSIVSVFVMSGIIHLFVLLMKGKNEFYQTFKALIYGNTPKYILSFFLSPISILVYPNFFGMKQPSPEFLIWLIPTSILGIIVAIYAFYLKVIAIKKLQEISTFRAFTAVFLLPLALFIVIYIILIAVIVAIRL